MKWVHACRNCMRTTLSNIHLVDKCLILFMFILLLQSAYSLFFYGGSIQEKDTIDVIVRTASASIFGYVLSANFIRGTTAETQGKNANSNPPQEIKSSPPIDENTTRSHMGYQVSEPLETTEQERGHSSSDENNNSEKSTEGQLQIITATAIGLFCLFALLLLRNGSQWSAMLENSNSAATTVAQFRDFISGCVGFLIGCPTNNVKK